MAILFSRRIDPFVIMNQLSFVTLVLFLWHDLFSYFV